MTGVWGMRMNLNDDQVYQERNSALLPVCLFCRNLKLIITNGLADLPIIYISFFFWFILYIKLTNGDEKTCHDRNKENF